MHPDNPSRPEGAQPGATPAQAPDTAPASPKAELDYKATMQARYADLLIAHLSLMDIELPPPPSKSSND